MSKSFLFLSTLTSLLFFFDLPADARTSPNDIAKIFFSNLQHEGPEVALKQLYAASYLEADLKAELAKFDEDKVGKYMGKELLSSEWMGRSYFISTYFIKYEKKFLLVTFQYFRPDNVWRLAHCRIEEDFTEDFSEAGRYHLQELYDEQQ